MSKAVSVRHPSGSSRAKTLWKVRDAKERGDAYYDQASEQTVVSGDAFRQEVWSEHLQQPALALDEALRIVVVWDDAGSRDQNLSVFSHRAGEWTSSNFLVCAGRREGLFVHLICARLDVFLRSHSDW